MKQFFRWFGFCWLLFIMLQVTPLHAQEQNVLAEDRVAAAANATCLAPGNKLCFAPAVEVMDVGNEANSIAVGKINGDNHLDIVSASMGADKLKIRFGCGDGSFNCGGYTWTTGDGPADVALADFNGDGKTDLAAVNHWQERVRLRWGHSNWASYSHYATANKPWRISTGDLNGDGLADFATANFAPGNDSITVRLRKAAGGFEIATLAANDGARAIQLGDCDQDGDLDLFYNDGYNAEGALRVRRNNGNGGFGAPLTTSVGELNGGQIYGIALADYNKDGKLDFVATLNNHKLVRGLGAGDCTFTNLIFSAVPSNPGQIYAADFDNDGNRDLIVAHGLGRQITFFLGAGNGNFSGPFALELDNAAWGVDGSDWVWDVGVGNFDSDGLPDVAFTGQSKSYVLLSDAGNGVVFKGIYHVALGAATVQLNSTGQLAVGAFGPSGADGVASRLNSRNGWQAALKTHFSLLSDLRLTAFRTTPTGEDAQASALKLAAQSSLLFVTPTFDEPTYRIDYLLGDDLRKQEANRPSGSQAFPIPFDELNCLLSDTASHICDFIAVFQEYDDGACGWELHFAQPVQITTSDNTIVSVDRVRLVEELPSGEVPVPMLFAKITLQGAGLRSLIMTSEEFPATSSDLPPGASQVDAEQTADGIVIDVDASGFMPAHAAIQLGMTVTWRNRSDQPITIQSGRAVTTAATNVFLPLIANGGATAQQATAVAADSAAPALPTLLASESFSGVIPAGGELSRVFVQPGHHPYHNPALPNFPGDIVALPPQRSPCARTPGADFDGDGAGDLAIGVPVDSVSGQADAGLVNVIYGALGTSIEQIWQQNHNLIGVAQPKDYFGHALASGDFDNDGFCDLAVGVPGEGIDNVAGAGVVHIIHGAGGGLSAFGDQLWHQGATGINGRQEAYDGYGAALASGDFNGDSYDDLAVGIPYENLEGGTTLVNAGAVNVIYGTAQGLTANAGPGNQVWTRTTVAGVAAAGDTFGHTLAAGDFNSDGFVDLVIGIVNADASGDASDADAGAINVLYGSANGLATSAGPGAQEWSQASPGVSGVAEGNDFFGSALASGDFDNDGFTDLAIGVFGEDIAGDSVIRNAGAVNVLFGTLNGLSATGNQLWTQADLTGVAQGGSCNEAGQFCGDWFGWALAAGDFNQDGYGDLAIGAPGDTLLLTPLPAPAVGLHVGAVNVVYGAAAGLTAANNQLWHQDTPGLIGRAEVEDRFGYALTVGDFDGDGVDDLAVGTPGEDIEEGGVLKIANAGAANVIYGTAVPSGLTAADNQLWVQGNPYANAETSTTLGSAEADDGFGAALVGSPAGVVRPHATVPE